MTLFETQTCRHGRYGRCPMCEISTAKTRSDAELAIKPSAATLRDKVYAYIESHGPVCDERIAEALGMNPSTARPRRLELERGAKVVASGSQMTRAGRKAVAWVVSTSSDQD